MACSSFSRLLQVMKLKPLTKKPTRDAVTGVYRHCVFLSSPPGAVCCVRYYANAPNANVSSRERKRKQTLTKITLVGVDENITVISLEEAQKIAKRRELKLVKVGDTDGKTERPLYRMMTGAQYFEEDLRERKAKSEKRKTEMKGEKLLTISDKIGESDLNAKLKVVRKWLEKKHQVKCVISSTDEKLTENIVNEIESVAKEYGRLVQKRTKGKEIRFSILPKMDAKEQKTDANEQKMDGNEQKMDAKEQKNAEEPVM